MHPLSLSGYEDSFDRIYQPFSTENESDSTRDNISGGGKNSLIEGATTASIAASPFAWTPPKNQKEEEKMQNFYLQVAYEGNAFCGWQTQLKNLVKPSVQRTLEEWLTVLQNNGHALEADIIVDAVKNADRKRERRLKKQGKRETKNVTKKDSRSENSFSTAPRIRWADLPVAGRTDAGVSAIGQVCRFRTHRKDLTAEMISDYLTNRITTAPEISQSLGITKIVKVSRSFHPTFSTSCRAYAYLIDVDTEHNSDCDGVLELFKGGRAKHQISLLDGMLQKLEGKALDYIGLSYGRVKTLNTICTLHHARAKLVRYETSAGAKSRARTAVCIELVGDRFLRRMVRLLVEASVRLVSTAEKNAETEPPVIGGIADCGATTDALLQLVEKRDRTIVGRPAPPDGLVFVGARLPLA
ncbi:unnamed protein product [Pseudo-nitzschia multistriata]|uniref:Uncharacterized protein n=1 Tax=Pseudo-nitzschia multistriata TaxID=183589 RepID=A0A448ZEQ7_9STRA|nr:unnamed protein product [Pseudo-nitzschia multistriata]